jgi:mRNA-degrading endonuclease RelE of RelBE toxin-antitoxin system
MKDTRRVRAGRYRLVIRQDHLAHVVPIVVIRRRPT